VLTLNGSTRNEMFISLPIIIREYSGIISVNHIIGTLGSSAGTCLSRYSREDSHDHHRVQKLGENEDRRERSSFVAFVADKTNSPAFVHLAKSFKLFLRFRHWDFRKIRVRSHLDDSFKHFLRFLRYLALFFTT
jgi:hypothetical protein